MSTHTDRTFITNEGEGSLLQRFNVLIRDTKHFDALVGYFYISGFYQLHPALEKAEKIRILIGISTDKAVHDVISRTQAREQYANRLVAEMENCDDSPEVETGIQKFAKWLSSGKLEIKIYRRDKIHAKVYIMTFGEGDRDKGRVITGSSNLTEAGLVANLEFNVELKNAADHEFAKEKFEELWADAVDLKEQCEDTLHNHTWFNDQITPYELYLKCLYEYFQFDLAAETTEREAENLPPDFKRFTYQDQAVRNAKKILEEYGGVFLSDVVGLGKTYMSALLAKQLPGKSLVIAPPTLLDPANPGSWRSVFHDFNLHADCESIGSLDKILKKNTDVYKNVFIDEAHRFRNEGTDTHEMLSRICRGKRVILVTATPFNNSPLDILSQIKLFQNARKSTIPNKPDLQDFFTRLANDLRGIDRGKDPEKHAKTAQYNAYLIREQVLKYLMVRRTRHEIETYFAADLEKQGLKFPTVADPSPAFYQLNSEESPIFHSTIKIIGEQLTYARYRPLSYYTGSDDLENLTVQAQVNLGTFMKILLIKRLESSFHAFRQTISRFIRYHEEFLAQMEEGKVYLSKSSVHKIFHLLAEENEEGIEEILYLGKAQVFPASDFKPALKEDLENDLQLLRHIANLWENSITRDPKLSRLLMLLNAMREATDGAFGKRIIFTESKETAYYLTEQLKEAGHTVIAFSSESSDAERREVIENFDANASPRSDDYDTLITTEILAEGVNLHRANVVINYDIPWNPTRLMQRVGRINRVDTPFDHIYTYNFFPSDEANDEIKLKEAAVAKISAFISLLGADAQLLTDGEVIESHELFQRLISRDNITGEEEGADSELRHLALIRGIRDKDPVLFNKIKRLPKKARTARQHSDFPDTLLTYFRKGKLHKFLITERGGAAPLDFMQAAALLAATEKTPRQAMPADFYDKLRQNDQKFTDMTHSSRTDPQVPPPQSGEGRLMRVLKGLNKQQYTPEQDAFVKKVTERLLVGALPKQTVRNAYKALDKIIKAAGKESPNWLDCLAALEKSIPVGLLAEHISANNPNLRESREVILSEYLTT